MTKHEMTKKVFWLYWPKKVSKCCRNSAKRDRKKAISAAIVHFCRNTLLAEMPSFAETFRQLPKVSAKIVCFWLNSSSRYCTNMPFDGVSFPTIAILGNCPKGKGKDTLGRAEVTARLDVRPRVVSISVIQSPPSA